MLRRQANFVGLRVRGVSRGIRTTTVRHCALQSAALSAAERIANPSQATPASGPAGGVLSPEDPRIVWREHWCVAKKVPYYHNMLTNETTWDVPEKFVTRFPTYHKELNQKVQVQADGTVQYLPSDGSVPTTEMPLDMANLPLKKKLALYGSGGLILYLIIHNIFLSCVFCSMYFFGIDLVHIARSYGFNAKEAEASSEMGGDTKAVKKAPTFVGTFVTAVILNKMTVPFQLLLTLTLAPRVVPKLQPLANRLIPKLKRMIPFMH